MVRLAASVPRYPSVLDEELERFAEDCTPRAYVPSVPSRLEEELDRLKDRA